MPQQQVTSMLGTVSQGAQAASVVCQVEKIRGWAVGAWTEGPGTPMQQ
jgi:hypothetical protein